MKTRSALNTQQFSWIPAGTQTAATRDGQGIAAVAKYPTELSEALQKH